MTAERHVVNVERWLWKPLRQRWRWNVTWSARVQEPSFSYSGLSGPSGYALTRWGAQRRALKAVRRGPEFKKRVSPLVAVGALFAEVQAQMARLARAAMSARPAPRFTYAVSVERDGEQCSIESVDLVRQVG